MNLSIPNEYPIYEMGYNNEYPLEQLFIHNFDTLPSKFFEKNKKYNFNLYDYLIENNFKTIGKVEVYNKKVNHNVVNIILFNHEKKMMINLLKNDSGVNLEFYYKCLDEITNLIDFKVLDTFLLEEKKSNISLITSYNGSLETEEFVLNINDTDIKLNYGDSFVAKNNLILEKLNQNNGKGIVLLHGLPGSGKSSYLRYLTTQIKEKEILFVPPSMADALSDPSIVTFLMDYKNSILIIEDGEKIISDRSSNGSSVGVSNILNLTDGILSDCLNIQIIVTFNMEREKIDRALLRKGRLICEHKFDKLTVKDSNLLLKHLGKEYVTNESMVLTDIYNIDEEIYKEENKQSKIVFI
jgi:hypothetical protein